MKREAVVIELPSWLLDEAYEALKEDVGHVGYGEVTEAIQGVVEDFLEVVASGNHYCRQRMELREALLNARYARRRRELFGPCAADIKNAASVVGTGRR